MGSSGRPAGELHCIGSEMRTAQLCTASCQRLRATHADICADNLVCVCVGLSRLAQVPGTGLGGGGASTGSAGGSPVGVGISGRPVSAHATPGASALAPSPSVGGLIVVRSSCLLGIRSRGHGVANEIETSGAGALHGSWPFPEVAMRTQT